MEGSEARKKQPNILVTGGSGFLGSRIVEEMMDPSSPFYPCQIRVFDINEYPGEAEVEFFRGDIRDAGAVDKACEGTDLVIHSAAIIDWGTHSDEEVLSINAGGTRNVIEACKKHGIKYLVYTSSLDAVYAGKPLTDIDETLEYPTEHRTIYCKSKYLAEELVLRENGNGLAACILRPSDIYGEGDPYHMGSLINMAKNGFYVRLGNGKSKCQHVYVGNMAHAHVSAAAAMWNGSHKIDGEIYFISDGNDNFFKFFDRIVEGAGYRIFPKNLWLPRGLAYSMASVSELIARMMRPVKKYNPRFSRFAVTYTCTDFTFSTDKAEREFGYRPKYSQQEALENTIRYYRQERISRSK